MQADGGVDRLLESMGRFAVQVQVISAFREGEIALQEHPEWGPRLVFGRLWEELGLAGRVPRTSPVVGRAQGGKYQCVQVVVGVVLTGDGWPTCLRVWPGNTSDAKTVVPILVAIRDARYDGKHVLRTSTSWDAERVALAWKSLWWVERYFRDFKGPIGARPIYHRLEDRVRGHLLGCFLALYLAVDLRKRLAALGEPLPRPERVPALVLAPRHQPTHSTHGHCVVPAGHDVGGVHLVLEVEAEDRVEDDAGHERALVLPIRVDLDRLFPGARETGSSSASAAFPRHTE